MKTILFFFATCGVVLGAPVAPADLSTNALAGMPSGPQVFGIFLGRTPCQELSHQLHAVASDECNKVKCRLILYQDPVTHTPTTYEWAGKIRWTGKWSMVKGTKSDPEAIVYRLEPQESEGFLSLLKVDDNILYFLNRDGEPLVGNIQFSYVLNRAR